MHFTLCDLAADIAQNAAESGASVVEADFTETENEFRFRFSDNGKGMTEEELEKAKDPFHTDGKKHPGRRVGLGIPFLIQTASQTGGGWNIRTQKGSGTTVEANFDLTNLDAPPIGDVPGLIRTVFLFEGPTETIIRRNYDGKRGRTAYEVRKSELADALGGLEDAGALVLLDKYLRSLEEDEEENEA
ncbi:MAG: ATP-binding protein [Treponemataceae bacterium]